MKRITKNPFPGIVTVSRMIGFLLLFAFIRELTFFTNKHYSEYMSVQVKWMIGSVIVVYINFCNTITVIKNHRVLFFW
ncbi:hypothetical protein GLOIN_2v405621 [Rhizophagus irregularis DAOM 181602=DAOM 197198]|uniref:Uncharacterized protein n=1 Tax=Rhizophagus irregularis (strain DAOM 181602 / DAOM 197198 / MUCL 43194) TaxID=747089 RepID=A0A2P4PK80_RHIID|nr:hypothetical protein GLOIN_2v405621 [Rhizophagus irregularis DAOM 181602=DAOM 197198]POG65770.1 hypothetical protein GLOIN_2v405621 [Rhizophagus irregularis DAOM 181602=DAOM 197198]GET66148.1 hypothetical protein GLOIN_2v405621 [Rhizophagus irregularis DAOM 181602=DAOM 197198]|eukprot:XP_025172636.1 hypothetical protein GLOIN_2v405621 [Rhizophagus irregularis DAOM 181602=DAOM 197198]